MLIGEVSQRFEVPIDTLRYYDRIGLLCPERCNGKRIYDERHLAKLEDILKMRTLLFSLDEIRELLSLDEQIEQGLQNNTIDSEQVRALYSALQTKHAEVLRRQHELVQVKHLLEHLLEKTKGVIQ